MINSKVPTKINKEILPKLVDDTSLRKKLAIYFDLKHLYISSIILNYKSRYKEIADHFGISDSNLRGKIKMLKEDGLVRSEGKNLVLVSFKKFRKKFNLKSKDSYWFEFTPHIEEMMDYILLNKNQLKQKNAFVKKEVKERCADSKDPITRRKIKQFVNKNYDKIASRNLVCGLESVVNKDFSKANPNFTVSRQGAAKVLFRKSKSTGSRRIKRLVKLGFITDTPHSIFVEKCANYTIFLKRRLDRRFYYQHESIRFRYPNTIKMVKNFMG